MVGFGFIPFHDAVEPTRRVLIALSPCPAPSPGNQKQNAAMNGPTAATPLTAESPLSDETDLRVGEEKSQAEVVI